MDRPQHPGEHGVRLGPTFGSVSAADLARDHGGAQRMLGAPVGRIDRIGFEKEGKHRNSVAILPSGSPSCLFSTTASVTAAGPSCAAAPSAFEFGDQLLARGRAPARLHALVMPRFNREYKSMLRRLRRSKGHSRATIR